MLLCAVFLGGLDVTILNTALPALSKDLSPRSWELPLVIDGYPLALAAFLVSGAKFGDRWGRKRAFLIGLATFAAASATAGSISIPFVVIIARVVQGIGDALIISSVVATIQVTFADQRGRSIAYGLWTAAVSTGLAVGPILGGTLVETLGWRWTFFVNVPVAALAGVLAIAWMRDSRVPDAARLDILSLALSVLGLGSIVYALQRSTEFGLVVPIVGVVGIVAVWWFVRRQRRLPVPLLDVGMFSVRPFSLTAVGIVIGAGCFSGLLYLLSQDLQFVDGRSPVSAGLAVVPFAIATAVGGIVSPAVSRALGHPVATMASLLVQAAALTWIATTSLWLPGALVAMGLAGGIVASVAADLLMSYASERHAGEAGAVQETAFALGSGLGVAVFGTIATLTYRISVSPHLDPAEHAAADSLSAALKHANGLPAAAGHTLRSNATAAFGTGYTVALLVGAGLATIAGLVIGLRVKDIPDNHLPASATPDRGPTSLSATGGP